VLVGLRRWFVDLESSAGSFPTRREVHWRIAPATGFKFIKPRHFRRVPAIRVVPAQKAPRYDDDFMKIAWGRRRKKGLRIVRI
jgi:hypothetical protein